MSKVVDTFIKLKGCRMQDRIKRDYEWQLEIENEINNFESIVDDYISICGYNYNDACVAAENYLITLENDLNNE